MWKKRLNRVLATVYPDWIDLAMNAINVWRGLYWKKVPAGSLVGKYRSDFRSRPFQSGPVLFDDPQIVESISVYNGIEQREYFLAYPGEVLFEPRYGWAMSRNGELLMDSLPYTYYTLLPGLRHYLRALHPPRDIIRVDRIASMRDIGDKNYYHFYDDHLCKLPFFSKMGLDDDIPLLVSDVIYRKPYFRDALERTGLDRRKWIVQGKEYVAAGESYFCGTMRITREYLDRVLEMLKPPRPNPNRRRRVFITRGKGDGRCIVNLSEIEEVLARFDFEPVNPDTLDLAGQMRLFSEAGMVVGIHGAGLTNIIYRAGQPLDVIEIFPPNNIPAMYYWIALAYGFRYDAVVGEKGELKRAERQQWAKIDFYVDPERLGSKVAAMLGDRGRPELPTQEGGR